MFRGWFKNRRRVIGTAVVSALLCVVFVGLGVALISRGLDGADKLASVISMFVGVASLGTAVVALRKIPQYEGNVVRVESKHGKVKGTVTGIEARRLTSGLVSKIETGDVQAGGSVTGVRIGDVTGYDSTAKGKRSDDGD